MSFRCAIRLLVAGSLLSAGSAWANDYITELEARAFRGDREAQAALAHVYKKTGNKKAGREAKQKARGSAATYEQRYEPTRPSLGNRFEGQRPSGATARREVARGRYEPRRPETTMAPPLGNAEYANRSDWDRARRDYDRLDSMRRSYERADSYGRDYREVKEKKKKGSLGKKILLSPFKFGFGVSKKAVKKLSVGWLPLM